MIDCFWTLESDTDIPEQRPERILPDGCVEIILNFASPFAQHTGETTHVQPRNFIVGQMTGPMLIAPTGPVQLIGIRFHPGGTAPFLRLPIHDLTDQVVELASFARTLEAKLLADTLHLPQTTAKVFAIEKVLTRCFKTVKAICVCSKLQRGSSTAQE